MSDFLTKPIDAEKLRAALARVLGDAADGPRSGR
jgi:CheY-like chemotaxis protein